MHHHVTGGDQQRITSDESPTWAEAPRMAMRATQRTVVTSTWLRSVPSHLHTIQQSVKLL
jgi:hypothetical protein